MFKPTKEASGQISPVLHKAQPAVNAMQSMRILENKVSLFQDFFIWVWSSSEILTHCFRQRISSQMGRALDASLSFNFHVVVVWKNHYLSLCGFSWARLLC